jgi:hypothetical protein
MRPAPSLPYGASRRQSGVLGMRFSVMRRVFENWSAAIHHRARSHSFWPDSRGRWISQVTAVESTAVAVIVAHAFAPRSPPPPRRTAICQSAWVYIDPSVEASFANLRRSPPPPQENADCEPITYINPIRLGVVGQVLVVRISSCSNVECASCEQAGDNVFATSITHSAKTDRKRANAPQKQGRKTENFEPSARRKT